MSPGKQSSFTLTKLFDAKSDYKNDFVISFKKYIKFTLLKNLII